MESGLDLRRIHLLPTAALDDEEFRRATLFAFSQIHCLQFACTATPLKKNKSVTWHFANYKIEGGKATNAPDIPQNPSSHTQTDLQACSPPPDIYRPTTL